MKKVDYIIVGLGLAGLAFARKLEKNSKSFIVFEDDSQHSSKVAGGMYNPVILKRFTPVWDAKNQLEIALPFYKEMEEKFDTTYNIPIDIGRLLTSIEEQNNWFATCDHPLLTDYMIPKIDNKKYSGIESPFGYGKLTKTGRIDVKKLLKDFSNYLVKKEAIRFEPFNYEEIQFENDAVKYKDIEASKIIFCEGFGIKKNPFFNYLPMQEAKGELITIHASELAVDFLLKSGVFILPLGAHNFLVGATFNWKDKTNNPTQEGKKELVEKLNKIINVDYTVIDQVAGIRPTVKDRRPLVGIHPTCPQLVVLNGLGTRGVMIAPTVSQELYNHLENKTPLKQEINIMRFD